MIMWIKSFLWTVSIIQGYLYSGLCMFSLPVCHIYIQISDKPREGCRRAMQNYNRE